jgi:hypothetical protein
MQHSAIEQTGRITKALFMYVLLAGPLFVFACSAIYSEEPLGEEIARLEPEEWTGVWWLEDSEVFRVHLPDRNSGILQFVNICRPSKSDLVTFREFRWAGATWYFPVELVTRNQGESLYRTTEVLRRFGDQLWVLTVNDTRVRFLVEQGMLPGRVGVHGEPILGPITRANYDIILSEDQPLFHWQRAFILVRLPKGARPLPENTARKIVVEETLH